MAAAAEEEEGEDSIIKEASEAREEWEGEDLRLKSRGVVQVLEEGMLLLLLHP